MKRLIAILSLFSFSAHASGGYTWISNLHLGIPEYLVGLVLVGLLILAFGLLYKLRIAKVENIIIGDKSG